MLNSILNYIGLKRTLEDQLFKIIYLKMRRGTYCSPCKIFHDEVFAML